MNKRICSVEDFLIHMYGAGKSNRLSFSESSTFTLFWDQARGDEPEISSRPQPLQDSVVQKIITLTRLLTRFDKGCPVLLQFWTPIETGSGRKMLTVSKQPFGVGNLYYGLCMYRRHCIEMESNKDDGHGEGPPERVFRQQFPEYCPDIVCYFTNEFPSKACAKDCGIVSYGALPFFRYDETESQHCVGVLEFVSMNNFDFSIHVFPVIPELKELNFGRPSAHLHECDRIREDILLTKFDIRNMLNYVREVHQSPLIQVWIPCMCNHKPHQNKLFCDMRICSDNLRCISEFKNCSSIHGAYYVEERKGWVGRAYSDKKPCFCSATTQFHISDYPFIHLTRSLGLAACFVIPLESIHPTIGPLFLEIFLPPDQNHINGNPVEKLKSLLHTVDEGFSKLNKDGESKQDEDFSAEVSYSDSEKIDYFCVKRITKVNTEKTCTTESSPKDTNAQDAKSSATAEEYYISKMIIGDRKRNKITLDELRIYFGSTMEEAARSLGVSRSTLKRISRKFGIDRWPYHKKHKISSLLQFQALNNATEKEAPHTHLQTENSAAERYGLFGEFRSDSSINRGSADDSVPSSTVDDRSRSYREDADDPVPSSIRQSETVFIKAEYKNDAVMLRMESNFGVEELYRELNRRFALHAEKFKIKYQYKDEWYLIACDEDLHLGLEMTRPTTGNHTIHLSIIIPEM